MISDDMTETERKRTESRSTDSTKNAERHAFASLRGNEEYILGVKKVIFPTIFGIIAGILSFTLTNPAEGDGLLIAMIFILIQRFIYPRYNMLKNAKDFLYLSFMTLFGWFISFTLLLNL